MSESFIDLSDNNYVITCSNCLLPKVILENVNLKAHLIFEVLYCYNRTEVLIIQPLWLVLMSLYSKGLKRLCGLLRTFIDYSNLSQSSAIIRDKEGFIDPRNYFCVIYNVFMNCEEDYS